MDLKGQLGELKFTLEIKRAATGETETFDLIGKICGDEVEKFLGEKDDNSTQHSS